MKMAKMDVISRLRVKFIITTVVILTLVFGFLLLVVNQITTRETNLQVKRLLLELVEGDGVKFRKNRIVEIQEDIENNHPWDMAPVGRMDDRFIIYQFNQPFNSDNIRNYFSIKITDDGSILDVISPFPLHYTDEEITSIATTVLDKGLESGLYQGLGFMVVPAEYGYLEVFADIQQESNIHSLVYKITIYTYAFSILISIVIAWFLSSWAVKPVRVAFNKQKRFVADASHELKTPLSVISANLDVLTGEVGENKWTEYIKNEISRMSKLVKDLLYLAKCDNEANKYQFTEFNLSRAVLSSILPFESTVFEQEKTLETDVEDNVTYVGDENAIKQVVVILLDNAVKHTDKGAVISVKLTVSGNKKVLTVRNTGSGISAEDQKKIFERFFRVDSSRNRETGGYGLGLAIAKSIADMHHARLTVNSVEGEYAEFSFHM